MLENKALLINLRISMWFGRKYDKKVSLEIEKTHNASNSGRYNKMLIDSKELSSLVSIVNKIKKNHYENTLPWGDEGERLLPIENYISYMDVYTNLEAQFSEKVENFLMDYENIKERSKKSLGDMFNLKDYPLREELRNKFNTSLLVFPVPDDDFRVAVDDVEALKEKARKEIGKRLSESNLFLWEKIKKMLEHISSKLLDKEAIFKNSMMSNLEELLVSIPKLNITEDKELDLVVKKMKHLVQDSDVLRENPLLRKDTGTFALSLLSEIKK